MMELVGRGVDLFIPLKGTCDMGSSGMNRWDGTSSTL
jgi:hypothetical protein